MSRLQIKKKKIIILKCRLLMLHNKNKSFLDQIVTYDEKYILYDNRQ